MTRIQALYRNLLTFLRENAEWVIISLVLGFVIWIVATLDDDPVQQRVLSQSVRIEFIEGEDVVRSSTAPRSADITLLAPRSTFEEITTEDIRLTADLSELTPGTHIVELHAEIITDDLRGRVVEVDPEQLSVEVVAVSERLIQVTPIISPSSARATAACDPGEVRVRGPAPEISRIGSAEARIDVADQTATVTDAYSIVLFDVNNTPITNLTTDPETVTCTVEIEQRDDTVMVAVVPNVIGEVPPGYVRSDDYVVEPEEIEVAGEAGALEALNGEVETEPIDVSGQTENFSRVVGVDLPPGVELVQSTQLITVTITITEPNTTVNFENVPIQILNLRTGLDAELSPASVSVSLTGRSSLVEGLTKEDISITVDLDGQGVGSHEDLQLTWSLLRESLRDAEITVQIQPSDRVDVTISEQIVPTPTPLGIIG